MQELSTFLISTANLTEEDRTTVLSYFRPKLLNKGDLLLKRGQVATNYYFLKSGGLRFYYQEDRELTAWIVQPGEFFTEISSLGPEKPTRFNIEAVECAEVCCITKTDMELLYKQIPAWQEFGRKIWEGMAIRMIDEIIRFQTMSVEERYLEFLKKPGFMQLISVKQMASYLGITPNALSRIRKNLR